MRLKIISVVLLTYIGICFTSCGQKNEKINEQLWLSTGIGGDQSSKIEQQELLPDDLRKSHDNSSNREKGKKERKELSDRARKNESLDLHPGYYGPKKKPYLLPKFKGHFGRNNSSHNGKKDKPEFSRLIVNLQKIDVHKEGESGWRTIIDYGVPGKDIDLKGAEEGEFKDLGALAIEPGKYTQVRLIVSNSAKAYIDNINGLPISEFEVKIPSGDQNGIHLIHPFEILTTGFTAFSLDFDIENSISKHGKKGPYIFKPRIKISSVQTDETFERNVGKDGGEIEIVDTMTFKVLPNGLESITPISVHLSETDLCCNKLSNVEIWGPVLEFGPSGTTFSPPAIIQFLVDDATILALGNKVQYLTVLTEDPQFGWIPIGGYFDPETKTVTGAVRHFSTISIGINSWFVPNDGGLGFELPQGQNRLGYNFSFPEDIPGFSTNSEMARSGQLFFKKFSQNVSKNIPTSHQFPFAQAADHCSGPAYSVDEVRDTLPLLSGKTADFRGACDTHDACYYTLGTNSEKCNLDFVANLNAACAQASTVKIFGKKYLEPASWAFCATWVDTMAILVEADASLAYSEAQRKQRQYRDWVQRLIQEFEIPISCSARSVLSGSGEMSINVEVEGSSNFDLASNADITWNSATSEGIKYTYIATVPKNSYVFTVSHRYQTSTPTKSTGCTIDQPGILAVHRFWKISLPDHFLTLNYNEGLQAGYTYEGIAFYVLQSHEQGTVPMYRCYLEGSGDHFTSLSSTCEGQNYEGVYGYIYDRNLPQPAGTKAVYRCYGNDDHLTTVNYPECELGGYVVEHQQGYVFGS